MKIITFEHLKEDIEIKLRLKISIFFVDVRKQLEKFS